MYIHTLPLLIDRHEHLWEIIVRLFNADNNNKKCCICSCMADSLTVQFVKIHC